MGEGAVHEGRFDERDRVSSLDASSHPEAELIVSLLLLRSPDVDFEVRWAMIQLAEILVKPAEEVVPKVVVHLPPPTPIFENTPALPTPKIKLFTGNSESPVSLSSLVGSPLTSSSSSVAVTQPSTPSTPSYEPSSFLQSGLPSPALRLTLNRPPAHAPPAIPPPKKKKEKAAVKAQKSGMSAMELIVCRKLLQKMVSLALSFYVYYSPETFPSIAV